MPKTILSRMISLIAFALALTFTTYAQTKPTVVSTDPPNGATGVSPTIVSFSVTFSKPMNTLSGCAAMTSNWTGAGGPGSRCVWSTDQKTMTVYRDPSSPLAPGSTVTATLNWPGYQGTKDAEGNILDTYTFSFTIGGVEKVPANAQKGFSWPYYLMTPTNLKQPAFLLVEPNNTGSPSADFAVHDAAARNQINYKSQFAEDLGCPYLVPVFPRPDSPYTQALDRGTLLTKLPGLERIDLQLIKMIDDARERLAAQGITVDSKIFLWGFSASGQFASRFVMLHPDRIKAASIGSPGYGPIVPVAQWNGKAVPYHTGISDLEQLTGVKFDAEAFRKIPLQIYTGDLDSNIVNWYLPEVDADVALIEEMFGGTGPEMFSRFAKYEAAYLSVGSSCQFVIFQGRVHTWADWSYTKEFFERNRATPPPPPLPKPAAFTLYFPHVAAYAGWETEIALLNSSDAIAVQGILQAFSAEGGPALESFVITLPPGGRREIRASSFFAHPQDVAYLAFHCDSGFISGYTRFSQPAYRATLPAAAGGREGWFPKIEQDGWTGIAFVNVDSESAHVILKAYDDNGSEVASQSITVPAGKKIVGMVNQVFQTDIGRAKYFKFRSDKKLLGFTVSASGDGQMLDGIQALPEYFPYAWRQK